MVRCLCPCPACVYPPHSFHCALVRRSVLPRDFPSTAPVFVFLQPVSHPWVDASNVVAGSSDLRNWNAQKDLGAIGKQHYGPCCVVSVAQTATTAVAVPCLLLCCAIAASQIIQYFARNPPSRKAPAPAPAPTSGAMPYGSRGFPSSAGYPTRGPTGYPPTAYPPTSGPPPAYPPTSGPSTSAGFTSYSSSAGPAYRAGMGPASPSSTANPSSSPPPPYSGPGPAAAAAAGGGGGGSSASASARPPTMPSIDLSKYRLTVPDFYAEINTARYSTTCYCLVLLPLERLNPPPWPCISVRRS